VGVVAFAVTVCSCAYDKRDLPEPVIPPPPDTAIIITCDTINAITYNNFVKNILETRCTAFSDCHGTDAPPGFDYTTYAVIKSKVDSGKFQERVLNLREMPEVPPSDSLDACTLLQLQKWVNDGAPE